LFIHFSGSSGHLHRNNLAPVYMQWAIRNRESNTRTAGLRVTGGSNLVFIDPASLRRTTATSAVATAQEPITMGTTASCLVLLCHPRTADLLVMMQDYKNLAPALPRLMEITFQDALNLQVCKSIVSNFVQLSSQDELFSVAVIFRSASEAHMGLVTHCNGCYGSAAKIRSISDA